MRHGCGTPSLAAACLVALACTARHDAAVSDSVATTPVVSEAAFVVSRKAAPDTLFDQQGRFCLVQGGSKWEAADSGQAYPCVSTAPDSSAR